MSPIPGHHLNETTWRRAQLAAFVLMTLAFIGLLYRAEHKAEHQVQRVEAHVTKIESPCLRYTYERTAHNKRLCEESFEKAVLTITHAEACAILRKAGLDIVDCAHARLRQERRRRHERADAKGGDALQQPSSNGHQQPGPREGGQGNEEQPSSPPAEGQDAPPVNLAPTVEGVNETVCSVNALGLRICH